MLDVPLKSLITPDEDTMSGIRITLPAKMPWDYSNASASKSLHFDRMQHEHAFEWGGFKRASSASGISLKAPREPLAFVRWVSRMGRLRLVASKKRLNQILGWHLVLYGQCMSCMGVFVSDKDVI